MSKRLLVVVITILAGVAGSALVPAAAAAGVHGLAPFPSNLLTTPDASQQTGLRIDLPKPDCSAAPSTCADIDVLDGLDGFNVQPRISIPFSGPIDVSTVSSATVHLLAAGCPTCAPIGINQVVWEPATNTLHVEPDELLSQHTTYLLVATTGVRDGSGKPVDRTTFQHDLNLGQSGSAATKA
jgi:hypothetical protein